MFKFCLLILLLITGTCTAADDPLQLKHKAGLLRLQGDYAGAIRIKDQLVERYPSSAIGYVFSLNTLVSQLAWDESQTRYDAQIRADAESTFDICKPAMIRNPSDYQGYYDCGQAHFAMSYLSALRGHYYRAGEHVNLAIKLLEKTLELNPELVDAKMHLGICYYRADNLPVYLRAVAWFVWFIPQGNSSKSLPYLEQVIASGDLFRETAKYVYADILTEQGLEGIRKATAIIEKLTIAYPGNRRFRMRYITLLSRQGLSQETIIAGNDFLRDRQRFDFNPFDINTVRFWITRAHMSLNNFNEAQDTFKIVNDQLNDGSIPASCQFLLTRAQLLDLAGHRDEAKSVYLDILEKDVSPECSEDINMAAERGLSEPYTGTSFIPG